MLKNNRPEPPVFNSVEEARRHLKERLVGGLRIFGMYGFDEGAPGHITARDPEYPDRFWVNPFGKSFRQIKVSDLICVDHDGNIVEGEGILNQAAFAIHAAVHKARPDVISAAHAHSIFGKTWCTLGRPLDPLTLDACALYDDHVVFNSFEGEVLDLSEGEAIAQGLGNKKAALLQHHGILTVGQTVDSAVWWFITVERACQSQFLAESIGKPNIVPPNVAERTRNQIGTEQAGWFNFQPMYENIIKEYPELLD